MTISRTVLEESVSWKSRAVPTPLTEGAKKPCACGGGQWTRLPDGTAYQIPHVLTHKVHSDR
jgi:hypothetical protein